MPRASVGKTVSARRLAFGILLGVVIITGALFVALRQHTATSKPTYATQTLQLNDRKIALEVADTPAKQELGLGQRKSLANDKGMVFQYTKPQQLCFWMKDMHFAIDMVWLDATKKVTHIETNVSPDTYPRTYCPEQLSQYVVELNANVSQQAGIQTGQQLKF